MQILSGNNNSISRPSFTVWWDQKGILHIIAKDTNACPNAIVSDFEFLKSLLNGKKACAIIDTTHSGFFNEEKIRQTKIELNYFYKAIAIVSKTIEGQRSGNIVSAITPYGIPAKTFADENEAESWLLKYL